eukprot:TRINITY_DN2185_c0_g3_i2.p1 TRINITY_DN2185_c0_g3~~TRINITY_DN2185_c0_g3_i2.p1  ORF type:complete len:305 (+),score=62.83 TRINITY_DN2185_c0_g3_i2:69-917(+)
MLPTRCGAALLLLAAAAAPAAGQLTGNCVDDWSGELQQSKVQCARLWKHGLCDELLSAIGTAGSFPEGHRTWQHCPASCGRCADWYEWAREHNIPDSIQAMTPPPSRKPCECLSSWTAASCGDQVLHGCPAASCDDQHDRPWCKVGSPGFCSGEVTRGGGWMYCAPRPEASTTQPGFRYPDVSTGAPKGGEGAQPGGKEAVEDGGGGGHRGGLGGAVIALIVILSLAALYCGAGIAVRSRDGARGWEVIPHYEFWRDLHLFLPDRCRGGWQRVPGGPDFDMF